MAGRQEHEGFGRPEKRKAITQAARKVFGRDGFTRAGVDVIAAEAGVSKRTIYNHFTDKEQLFLTVALEGAREVTATIEQIMDRHLRKIVDLEQDLIDFSMDRVAAVSAFADHFALVRVIEAEATRIPPPILKAWIDAGPQTAHLRLAPYLSRIAERGLLVLPDADRAAAHLTLLTITDVNHQTFYGTVPIPQDEVVKIITSGVSAFLRSYLPRP
ncbi:TetR/AcrR family transcriptional regulator [Kibdelosporangium phytohabitans]|uniref:TetR family transcriptional regulator n=1 Tax=Kibdelosporangium phytohabitans TaxID=860235 RepID=A0A0N9HUH9_9PSEU|nr:TetR/AcrR family transcriptional regulator [Kibdelosporangium phytohabitans]ALG05630.1 TetR family transcriptional regulator [Kibdelosporangium phytohabitans]MBE1466395.1 AcrR family transcriptional regulator [Kibdelosporangium phytohabitans]